MAAYKGMMLSLLMAVFASSVNADKCDGIADGYLYDYKEGGNCASSAMRCINGASSIWYYCNDKYYISINVDSKKAYCYLVDSMDCSTKPGIPKSLKDYCQGKENGIHPHPQTCMKYVQCSNGLTYVMDCPSGLYFNKKNNQCDYDTNVDCIVHN